MRTAHGDYYRLASTILKQLHIGPGRLSGNTRTRTAPCPRTLTRSFVFGWKETNGHGRQAQLRHSPGHLEGLRALPSIILHASLWRANGEVKQDTATFTSPDSKSGIAQDGSQGTGSWENSAISARSSLKCQLRTCGRFARTIYQEIFPWQGLFQPGWLPHPGQPGPLLPRPPRPQRSL